MVLKMGHILWIRAEWSSNNSMSS
ncbi:hypothetical protein NC653_036528 [Populus alba x Populus x berolinensis]|uniref:Uncharacterized protein n=1 Tax=Populus alba x Populus x berolinensis TaxID=444605 RepID=A0AAD6LK27_9ROSI|nr:hypothetical protein NC653_036528 [Populus alba x Populus x berolinensis]